MVKIAHLKTFNIGNWFGHKFDDQEYKWAKEKGRNDTMGSGERKIIDRVKVMRRKEKGA